MDDKTINVMDYIKSLEARIAILENAVNFVIDDMTPEGYKLWGVISPQRNDKEDNVHED